MKPNERRNWVRNEGARMSAAVRWGQRAQQREGKQPARAPHSGETVGPIDKEARRARMERAKAEEEARKQQEEKDEDTRRRMAEHHITPEYTTSITPWDEAWLEYRIATDAAEKRRDEAKLKKIEDALDKTLEDEEQAFDQKLKQIESDFASEMRLAKEKRAKAVEVYLAAKSAIGR